MKNSFQHFRYILIFLLSLGYSGYGVSNGEKKSWGTARLDYCNPKYTTNCSVATFKSRDKFLTNISVTFNVPVGNNVTFGGTAESSGDKVKVDYKFCVLLRQPWLLSFLQRQEMKMPFPCPFPADRFFLSNLNLPPTNLPLPLKRGKYKLTLELFRAIDQERVITMFIEGEIIKNKRKH